MNELRVLILSNMYPNYLGGIFIHNQTKHLIKAGCKATVIVPAPYCPKFLNFNSRWNTYKNIPEKEIIDSIPVYYPRYFRLPGMLFHS